VRDERLDEGRRGARDVRESELYSAGERGEELFGGPRAELSAWELRRNVSGVRLEEPGNIVLLFGGI